MNYDFMADDALTTTQEISTATLMLSQATSPLSTFADSTRILGQWVVNPWQATLEVASDPQHGINQANALPRPCGILGKFLPKSHRGPKGSARTSPEGLVPLPKIPGPCRRVCSAASDLRGSGT